MSATTDGGGPAFPTAVVRDERGFELTPASAGMSLRDHIAIEAMKQLLITYPASHESGTAKAAYSMADQMLHARRPR